jgi:hypothetical protein
MVVTGVVNAKNRRVVPFTRLFFLPLQVFIPSRA